MQKKSHNGAVVHTLLFSLYFINSSLNDSSSRPGDGPLRGYIGLEGKSGPDCAGVIWSNVKVNDHDVDGYGACTRQQQQQQQHGRILQVAQTYDIWSSPVHRQSYYTINPVASTRVDSVWITGAYKPLPPSLESCRNTRSGM